MITIIADTTSTISVTEAQKLGIIYLPQIIIFGEQSYRDDGELTHQSFLEKLKTSTTLPKTAAPPPALYLPIFKNIADEQGTAIVICPSGDVSGTYGSALSAAQDFPDAQIHIVDSRTVASGLGSIVRCAVDWAKQNLSVEQIISNIKGMAERERIYFVVDTLEYLRRGGRIGGAKALVGTLLQVKPFLTFKNGRVEPYESVRTKARAMARFREIILSECPRGENSYLTIMQGDAEKEATSLAEDLKQALGIDKIGIYDLPPAILVHAGPGVLGASYFI
jgi:DegV family protein with EDD domain